MPKGKRLQGKSRSKREKFRKFARIHLSSGNTSAEASANAPSISEERGKAVRQIKKNSSRHLLKSAIKTIRTGFNYLSLRFRRANKIALLFFVISISCIAGFLYLKKSYPVKIKSILTQVKEIQLNYKGFQTQGYSPVCGCYKEQRPEDWRGVVFATRHLRLERTGRLPLTAYMITVAAPERASWSSSGYRFSADIYFISLPADEAFNPNVLLSKNVPSSYRIIDKKHFDPKRYFMIFSDEGLNVNLLGDKPLGAWIPSDAAKVTIGYSKGMFPAAKTSALISEEYKIESTESLLQEIAGVPMGDFLGPNVVLWTDDAELNIMAGKNIIGVPDSSNQNRVVTALVANPPFSLRVACLPESSDAVSMYRNMLNTKVVKDSEEDYLSVLRHPEDESGTVRVLIPDIEEGTEEFAQVYSKMKENDLVKIPNIPGDFIGVDYDTGKEINRFKDLAWMEFRYPPIPPVLKVRYFMV